MSDTNGNTGEVRHETITVGPGLRAFALGIRAGDAARTKLETGDSSGTMAEQTAFYWLAVGVELAAKLPEADNDTQLAYISGAATRAPRPAASVTIDSIANAAFTNLLAPTGEDGEPEFDEYFVRGAISTLLSKAARQIEEGQDDFTLFDGNGAAVGTVTLNLWD